MSKLTIEKMNEGVVYFAETKSDMCETIEIGNFYGSLSIKKEDDQFYCCIENHDGFNWRKMKEKNFKHLIKAFDWVIYED